MSKAINIGVLRGIFAVSVFALLWAPCFAFAPRIVVTFRGLAVKYRLSAVPYRSQGTVLVPCRATAKRVGVTLVGDPKGHSVTLSFGGNSLYFESGTHGYKLNGHRQNMRASSEIKHGRLYVPIRLFADVTAGLLHAEIQ